MKTVILGNSGSGKTWLAERLSKFHSVPVVHLDDLFWTPGGFVHKRPEAERARMVESARTQASWIAEGVYGQLAAPFLEDAETLIWLDLDWPLCERRLHARSAASELHMLRAQSSQGLAALLSWAASYEARDDAMSRRGHGRLFDDFPGKKLRLLTEEDVSRYLVAALG
jgi:adenylate kinase family enzyme